MMVKGRTRLHPLMLLWLFLLLWVSGCCSIPYELGKAKEHWNRQDFRWLAEQQICCAASDDGCNQLYLLKGDACFRLAKQGQEPRKHYPCAAANLEAGAKNTRQWQMETFNLNRPQTYENLCESYRNWRDLEKGGTADEVNRLLVSNAQQFLTLEPGNLAAIYLLNNGDYAGLHACLLHPEACPSLCRDLTMIVQDLEQALPRARASKYEANYQQLLREVSKDQQLLPNCR